MTPLLRLLSLFQFVMKGKNGLASHGLEHGGEKAVKYGPDTTYDQARTEHARKTQMLEIAFMNMVQMFLAFF
jgi:hypothetical protein